MRSRAEIERAMVMTPRRTLLVELVLDVRDLLQQRSMLEQELLRRRQEHAENAEHLRRVYLERDALRAQLAAQAKPKRAKKEPQG